MILEVKVGLQDCFLGFKGGLLSFLATFWGFYSHQTLKSGLSGLPNPECQGQGSQTLQGQGQGPAYLFCKLEYCTLT